DGVDREVPAGEIRLQRPPVRHLRRLVGFWPVLLAAVCRDLADQTSLAKAHGAERDSGVPDRVGPAVGDLPHLTPPRVGGQIPVTVASAKENVPDRPADQGELVAFRGEPACPT